jgi:hypothetical protein
MDIVVSPASFAIAIGVGTSLLISFGILWTGTRSRQGEPANRDTASLVMLGIACVLTAAMVTAGALFISGGTAYLGLLKGALLLMMAFAILGMGFGLVRGLRSGRAVGGPGA